MRLLLAVLFAGLICLPVSAASAQSFAIEKTDQIPLDLGDEFAGQIVDLFKDTEGRYILTDWQQHVVWMVDGDGNLIRRIGQEGSGPGELWQPGGAVAFEDKIIVLDFGNNRVTIFSNDGSYVNDFRLAYPTASGILVSRNGHVAVNALWEQHLFTVYDIKGATIGIRGKKASDQGVGYTLGDQHFSQTHEGHVLYSTVKEYPVYRMTWDGKVLATYAADSPGYGPLEYPAGATIISYREIYKTWTPILRPLAVAGHVLVQRKKVNFEIGPTQYFGDLFTMDGAPVQLAMELPMQFYAAEDNLLYGIDTAPVDEGADNPYIVVYRLADGSDR